VKKREKDGKRGSRGVSESERGRERERERERERLQRVEQRGTHIFTDEIVSHDRSC
jgi:hypothetical protein